MTLEERVELLAFDRYLAEQGRPVVTDESEAEERRAAFRALLAAEQRRQHGEA